MATSNLFETDLGWFGLAATGDGSVEAIVIGRRSPRSAREDLLSLVEDHEGERDCLPDLRERLQAFARGEVVDFEDVILAPTVRGDFGRRVLAATRAIPYGETRSYGELAGVAGSPRAARAVGRVMATNRFPIVVPCHRVVGSGGRLVGFSAPGGTTVKSRMLSMEANALVTAG